VIHRVGFGKFWKIWAEHLDSGYGESREGRGGLTPVRHVGEQNAAGLRWCKQSDDPWISLRGLGGTPRASAAGHADVRGVVPIDNRSQGPEPYGSGLPCRGAGGKAARSKHDDALMEGAGRT